ncbi:MAG: MG2 domain-containing protein [Marinilabiliaceae bacterium]|nr:MG2 domain-containing protein [Marinilabiliaceae bacterium]
MKKHSIYCFLIAIVLLTVSCKNKKIDNTTFHSPYHPRIAAFTSGLIPTDGSIIIEFADSVASAVFGQEVQSNVVSISPKITGKWVWLDHRTLRFTPSAKLPPDKKWKVNILMKKLFPNEKEDFFFEFGTLPQNYRVITDALQLFDSESADAYKLTGKIVTADGVSEKEIEAMLKASIGKTSHNIKWTHSDAKTHYFEISPIKRSENASELILEYNGKPIDVDSKGSIEVKIPGINDFIVQSVEIIQSPRQLIRVVFSDIIKIKQDLTGLIVIKDIANVQYQLNENVVELYPTSQLYGDITLHIFPGIENVKGNKFDEMYIQNLQFASTNPAVEILGQGNIIPFSEGLMLNFKAVALKEVIVRIIKIYESNVPFFLQVNSLDGTSQLKRAGRLVHQSVLSLERDATLDLNQWNTFALDLSKMIQPDPGAVYRIELGFLKRQAIFPCAASDEYDLSLEEELKRLDGNFWDTPDDYYSEWDWGNYYNNYNWYDREDPCTSSYYTRDKWARRNLFASDLGLIAKAGNEGNFHVFVSDIRSTQPINDVTVELLNFQTQTIGKAKTNNDGMATIEIKEKPFLVVASKGKQKGYLRVDDGYMLSISRFDVSGQTVPKGMKGYIYGERGVWRPGDSIFISFILDDKTGKLPANYPVSFELLNPRGNMVNRQVRNHSSNRIYSFRTATDEDAITGIWLARVIVGDALFESPVRIETVKPNRLRIELDFGKDILKGDKNITGRLFSEWLHGAAAANLAADMAVTLLPSKTNFKNYQDFIFDDATRTIYPSEELIFSDKLDTRGHANLNFKPSLHQRAPGMLTASFRTRVYEESGSFSIDRTTVPYSPYSRYVGLKAPKGDKRGILLTDENHKIEVVTVTADGDAVSVNNLVYKVYKIDWRWWWEKSDEDLGRYVGSYSQNVITSGHVSTQNGKATIPFRINQPEWGRYLIHVSDEVGGHASSTVVLVDWPGWAQKPEGIDADAAIMLQFTPDKEKYEVGQTANITFPSAEGGRALVSLENGSSIVKTWWVQTNKGTTKFSFKITEDMTPNVYIHITLLQPHGQKDNDLPIRMYGIMPILVHSSASVLTPEIKTDKEWRPQSKTTITVSEKNNREMSYTLAVVDDGLLNLTRFKTPNAWNHFNAREALGVKSWDLYNLILGAYGGRIERLFAIGGGDELNAGDADKEGRRFEPMVRFLGPFDLKKGSNKHTIDVPNYVGSVRVMVVATAGTATGAAEQTVLVKQPLMVLGTLPRVLGPGEKVQLPVTIFASGAAVGEVNVTINTDKKFSMPEGNKKSVRFDKEGEKTIFFELNVAEVIGQGKVEIVAQSGKENASYTINIPIRNPNPPIMKVISEVVEGNGKVTLNYELPGAIGTNSAILEISTLPPMDFGRRLDFLLSYPHGCIEQIVSGGFPQIFLPEIVQLEPEAVSKSQHNVQSVINRLPSYQTNSGGFAYWSGGTAPDEWASTYAGHFMLEAEKRGFSVPSHLKSSWLTYQKRAVSDWQPDRTRHNRSSDFIQAYRLFTLALAGEANVSGMNRLRQQSNLSNSARWRLSAAYSLAGMKEVAKELTDAIPETSSEFGIDYYYTYGSPERDLAMVLETLVLLNEKERAARMAINLAKLMNSNQWMSTQTTAYCLLAMSTYAKGQNINKGETKIRYKINDDKAINHGFSMPLLRQDIYLEGKTKGSITFENNSAGQVFVNLIMKGQPFRDVNITPLSSELNMDIRYLDLEGKEIDISNIKQGTDFKAIVRVHNPGVVSVGNLALTQIFPSGWEIRNTRFEQTGNLHELDIPEYRDIRDDRVFSYFNLNSGQAKQFVTILHASFGGKFYMPAVSCEAMYDYSIRANSVGRWVEVRR